MRAYFTLLVETSNIQLPILFTTENLFQKLVAIASEWKSVGEALSLHKERLDEISTTNGDNEACLREMLELYMMRSDLNHNWEEIGGALRNVGQEQLADGVSGLGQTSGR